MSCISSRLRSIDIVGIFDMDAVTVDESDTVSETSAFLSLGGELEDVDKLLSNEENLNFCLELPDDARLALLRFSSDMIELDRDSFPLVAVSSSSFFVEYISLFNNELLFFLNRGFIG